MNLKLLVVDLSTETYSIRTMSAPICRKYLGGLGLGVKILFDNLRKGIDPFSEENVLIFAASIFNGTDWPASGRFEVVHKSPLTGILGYSNCGGYFGRELRRTRFDVVAITGKAKRPLLLYLEKGKVEFEEASELWGMDTFQTQTVLKERYGEDIEIACLGPAGENLVKFASIITRFGRAAGRTGTGATMGAKRLKALVVKGSGDVNIHDKERFLRLADEAFEAIRTSKYISGLARLGTASIVNVVNKMGRFPTKNFQSGVFREADRIDGISLERNFKLKKIPCFRCPINCAIHTFVGGTWSKGPEYETINSLGARCGCGDLKVIVEGNYLCNKYGMDTISTGAVIAFAMECYEKGILKQGDLRWGNGKAILDSIREIAYKKGIGKVLSEGVKKASNFIGQDSENFAMHVKGLEIPAQDSRAQQSMGLAHVTSWRGADHLTAFPIIDETPFPKEAKRRFGENLLPEITDPLSTKYKGILVKEGEDFCAVVDSLGICKYGTQFPPVLFWDELLEGINAATGLALNLKELKQIGERICNLRQLFNLREGMNISHYTVPKRLLTEPEPAGPSKGKVLELSSMLDEYLAFRGWNKNGIPNEEKLRELDLEKEASEISVRLSACKSKR